jgi:hypothetical protein
MRLRNLQVLFLAFLNPPELCSQFKVMLALNIGDSLVKSCQKKSKLWATGSVWAVGKPSILNRNSSATSLSLSEPLTASSQTTTDEPSDFLAMELRDRLQRQSSQ